MSCENIKKDLFSFKIVCENDLKRASDCFSDTLRFKFSRGDPPYPPDERGGGAIPLSYSPPARALALGVCGNDTNIAEPPISYLEPFTSNHKWGENLL